MVLALSYRLRGQFGVESALFVVLCFVCLGLPNSNRPLVLCLLFVACVVRLLYGAFVLESIKMVVRVLFVRWDIIRHDVDVCTKTDIYYLETAQGEKVFCVAAIPGGVGNCWLLSYVNPVGVAQCLYVEMVVNVPFRHWVCVKNSWQESPRRALYYLETIEAQQVIVAVAIRAGGNQLVYQRFGDFVQDYRNSLPLGHVLMWNYSYQLNAWLDDIVYHSFVRCSNEVPGDTERLPCLLREYFDANGSSTWILLRHGSRAWPVEVVNHEFHEGWDSFREAHKLEVEYKLILACERKWIFKTIMFDRHDRELVFAWSGPNGYWRDLHPPAVLLALLWLVCAVLVCLQLSWLTKLVLKFGYFHLLRVQLQNPTVQFMVIVFHGHNDSERLYDWFSPVVLTLLWVISGVLPSCYVFRFEEAKCVWFLLALNRRRAEFVPVVGAMLIHVFFIRLVYVKYHYYDRPHGGFYYVIPIKGQRIIAVVARHRGTSHLDYKAYSNLERDYKDILGLGDNLRWNLKSDLVHWLDALVHNSFLRYSTVGVGQYWNLKHIWLVSDMSNTVVVDPFYDKSNRCIVLEKTI
ncbi:hypothetical protein RHGRI_029210 [Rhododendron griersonianum]|uniref:Uncharacterized protein n=1 Tax=Rhododendron griersonianum TaxID=479676 RepID=A0AAV6IN58_9ERIC|nr:hypothetical protein RHGRI_029210 [Rhododendron griersonianum]